MLDGTAPGVAVRSKLWDKSVVKKFKGAAERAEKPIDLTLREITRSGGVLWRACQLQGVLRGIRRRPGPHRHEYHAGPLAPESAT